MTSDIKPAAVVIVGAGGMGTVIAKRVAAGRLLILADFSEKSLQTASVQLENDGHIVQTHKVDVSDVESVKKLANDAAAIGRIEAVVHAAGLSPAMASAERVLKVDLLGTAIVIDAFANHISPGGSLVCIASMAGQPLIGKLPADAEQHLAQAPIETLLSHSVMKMADNSSGHAYGLSKRANQLRVQFAARQYGARGLRINSVSPGVIHTPMIKVELKAVASQVIKDLVKDSPAKRYGTPSDVASVVAFLVGSDASFITGTDILVDGGSFAVQRWAEATQCQEWMYPE